VANCRLNGVFSADYANYVIDFSNVSCSTTASVLIEFGTDAQTSYFGSLYFDNHSGADTGTLRTSSSAFLRVSRIGNEASASGSFNVFSPFATRITAVSGTYFGFGYSGWFAGCRDNTNSYSSINFVAGAGTLTGGTVRVYGCR
jgi:hypothetical protein